MLSPQKDYLTTQQIESFEQDGYLIVDFQLKNSDLDAVIEKVEPLYPPQYKSSRASPLRLQDAWSDVEEIRQLAVNENILSSLRQLFGRRALPFQTLNFPSATQQLAHSDTIHFNSSPKGYVAGVWVALEDIDMDNGPLIYYPGSHKLREYGMKDFSLTPGQQSYKEYEIAIQELIKEEELTPSYGTIGKGGALIWHSNLLHGGSALSDPSRSRHSQVTHYFFEGCKYYTPLDSAEKEMALRFPDWIPDNSRTLRNTKIGRKIQSLSNRVKRRIYS